MGITWTEVKAIIILNQMNFYSEPFSSLFIFAFIYHRNDE